jgi:enoyl-CoA hydratase/carnithine racemase
VAHSLNCTNSQFSSCMVETTAVLKLGPDAIELGQDLEVKEELLNLLKEADESKEVKAILMLHSPGALSEERYGEFITEVRGGGPSGKRTNPDWFERGSVLAREENGLNQIILAVHGCRKLTVAGIQGSVAEPFLGAALAFDFRFASQDTVFMPSHAEFGVPPCGALGYFLPRFLGLGKATSILLNPQPISGDRAFDLGLVSELLPETGFEETCIRKVNKFPLPPSAAVQGTKELLSLYHNRELEEYLGYESAVLRRLEIS